MSNVRPLSPLGWRTNDEYVPPEYPKVEVCVLKPFRFRPEIRRGKHLLPLEPARVVEVGEVIEMFEPDAKSMAALGKAKLL